MQEAGDRACRGREVENMAVEGRTHYATSAESTSYGAKIKRKDLECIYCMGCENIHFLAWPNQQISPDRITKYLAYLYRLTPTPARKVRS